MKIFSVVKVDDYESVSLWHSLPNHPVFGGQIISQALNVAFFTVGKDLSVRSLHASFLAPAYNEQPIKYRIETLRDGKTLKNREVRAYQNEKLLFIANICLSLESNYNFEYQKYVLSKNVPMITLSDFIVEKLHKTNENFCKALLKHVKYLDEYIEMQIGNLEKHKRLLYFKSRKTIETLADSTCFVAFVSDFFLLESGLSFFELDCFSNDITFFTSVDHSIHYYSLSSICDAVYILPECHKISGDRFFCTEKIFDKDGALIAEATQEGIIRFSQNVKLK